MSQAVIRQFEVNSNKPAEVWQHAYPVGNGRLGAMSFGGYPSEQILLNEETIWQGRNHNENSPASMFVIEDVRKLMWQGKLLEAQNMLNKDFIVKEIANRAFQPMGFLKMKYNSNDSPQKYRRYLSMNDALAVTMIETQDGNKIKQEVFSSNPDDVIVVRIESQKKDALSMTIDLDRYAFYTTEALDDKTLVISGQAQHMDATGNGVNKGTRFHGAIRVATQDGHSVKSGNSLKVENATIITLYISAATDYNKAEPYVSLRRDRLQACLVTISKVENQPYSTIRERHIADHKTYFERATVELGTTSKKQLQMATDERLKAVKKGATDPDLIEDLFQMGRYMLIASSRAGTLPPNLTGIWNGEPNPVCDADWHTNINVQQNYWHAELTNLSDLHEPFITIVDDIRRGDGKRLAQKLGCRGFLITHATHLWKQAAFTGCTWWGIWPMGGAWSTSHVMEHYRFSQDKNYLAKTAYPILTDNVLFCLDWLVENPTTGKLVSGPSASPENGFLIDGTKEVINACMGPAIDQQIVYESFTDFLEASSILGISNELTSQISVAREKLAPTQISPKTGLIMEWDKDYTQNELNHRHYSHLYALHPGCEISEKTPELLEAARKTVELRQINGGVPHGWSRAALLNLYARLNEGEKAYSTITYLLNNNTLPNLMHTQAPIFFDGNGAGTAGVVEMLLQSHGQDDVIRLLPALPKIWQTGSFNGLCARGGFVIDLQWKNSVPVKATVYSKTGMPFRLRSDIQTNVVSNGKPVDIKFDSQKNCYCFDTTPRASYDIQFHVASSKKR